MTTYQIEILRTEYKSKTFTITAEDRRKAVEQALEEAADMQSCLTLLSYPTNTNAQLLEPG